MANSPFPLIDAYMSVRLDADMRAAVPGKTLVKEWTTLPRPEMGGGSASPRAGETSPLRGGWLNAFWWLWLDDGRSIASVPPGSRDEITGIIAEAEKTSGEFDEARISRIKAAVDGALIKGGYASTEVFGQHLLMGCNRDLLAERDYSRCVRLTARDVPVAEGLEIPIECSPEGITFGVMFDGTVVAEAHHRNPGVGMGNVVEVSVHTAPKHRDRGFGKTAVSRLVRHAADLGGEARFACGYDNSAALALARSVGFVSYGRQLLLTAPFRKTL